MTNKKVLVLISFAFVIMILSALSIANSILIHSTAENKEAKMAKIIVYTYGILPDDKASFSVNIICNKTIKNIYNTELSGENKFYYIINSTMLRTIARYGCIIEVETSAQDYGEIPEAYYILPSAIRKSNTITLKFYYGIPLPIPRDFIDKVKLNNYENIGIIAKISYDSNNKEFIITDLEKRRITSLSDFHTNTLYRAINKKESKIVYIYISRKTRAITILDPAKPIWVLGNVNSKNIKSYQDIWPCMTYYHGSPKALLYIKRTRTVNRLMSKIISYSSLIGQSYPVCVHVEQRNVGGSNGQIDVIATPDKGEEFWNYDTYKVRYNLIFKKCSTKGKRDRPLAIIFYNNAEVDKVKNIYWGRTTIHLSQCMRLKDDSNWQWDTDKGTHQGYVHGLHMRVYAPYPADRFYDKDLGYFVIATAHCDGCGITEEQAEMRLVNIAANKGYTVYRNICWVETNISTNNGFVSYVEIP